MDWKKMLRPSLPKILLFAALSAALIPIGQYDTGIRCIKAPCPAGADASLLSYLLFFRGSLVYFNYPVPNLVAGLAFSWIISAFIIHYLSGRK
ncbi:MAG: hypothetical protein HY518_04300 [Candidatus Aenigmarchaeota archaeon]|nr:hypothetical protein [Candidatus Aenigmarchaeota archaeon]